MKMYIEMTDRKLATDQIKGNWEWISDRGRIQITETRHQKIDCFVTHPDHNYAV